MYRVGTRGTMLWLFENTVILCGDIRTEMIEHEICLLTWAFNHYTACKQCISSHSAYRPILSVTKM